jgi:penicillin-binding protein 1A
MSGGRVSAPVFKHFYTKFLQIHPERKRIFKIPYKVKTFTINGEKEYFTPISPPPNGKGNIPIF